MKRIEKKLKSKDVKAYVPNDEHAYWLFKYDRHYVAKHYREVSYLPFSRGSKRYMYMFWDEHPNITLFCYLSRYFEKQVGKNAEEVFHDFSKLGWKSSAEMYCYWDGYVDGKPYGYYVDESNRLMKVLESS